MHPHFLGLGTALPEHRMSQADALKITQDIACQDERQRRLATMLFRRSSVESRNTAVPHPIVYELLNSEVESIRKFGPTTGQRMQLYCENAPALAAEASGRALESAGLEARDITHLVTVSCTGFDAPGLDVSLFDTLGLKPTVQRVNVGYMGCHGAINGLRVARGLLAESPQARVLLNACELCSLHYRFTWDDEGIIGNALFADGSASVVLGQPAEGPNAEGWTLVASGSCLLPESRDSMSWRVGDHGFEMRLTSDVAPKIEAYLRGWMSEWLARFDLSIEGVSEWVIHPGGPKILDAAEAALGLTAQRTALSRQVLAELGNMSSPTVLFVLDRVKGASPGDHCVLLGFGPGLMAEACLLRRV